MRVVVTIDHRFYRTPDQQVWTQTSYAYPFWQRYLEVFDHVRVVARVKDVAIAPEDWKRADGNQVTFAAMPYFVGPQQYVLQAHRVKRAAQQTISPGDAVILRGGAGFVSTVEKQLQAHHHPFAVEVIGDPYDVFAPGANQHPLRPFFRWHLTRELKRRCAHAAIATYVTTAALQARYPCPARMMGVSDVELPESALVSQPRSWQPCDLQRPLHLIFVGTLEVLYKAPDILISALAIARQTAALDLRLTLIGEGRHRADLERQVQRLELTDVVTFRGQLTAGMAVRDALDQADVFVLPSYQEGLPRAMIEAMARALPCIGSTVGGVPELLPTDDLVPPGEAQALAVKLVEVAQHPERLSQMSARNLATAQRFRDHVLHAQRQEFFQHVRQITEHWGKQRHA